MLHHIDIAELERRKAHFEEELERLQQQLQRLRLRRAQVVHQRNELLRQHGTKQQHDELQRQFQELLKLFAATVEKRMMIIGQLSQCKRYLVLLKQEQGILLRLPDTPLLPSVERSVENIDTDRSTHPPNEQQKMTYRRRDRSSVPFLAVLLLLVLSLGFLLYAIFSSLHESSTIATTAPRSALTSTPKPVLSPAAKTSTLYPPLVSSYAGEINDIGVASTHTPMYLTQIKQDQNRISGSFQGLGLIGTFVGAVTSSGIVHFTVKIDAGLLIFDGNIKVGGDIRGTFKGVDQQGQSIGEYGDWNVSITH